MTVGYLRIHVYAYVYMYRSTCVRVRARITYKRLRLLFDRERACTSRPRHNLKFRGFSDDHEATVGYSGGSFYFIPSAISVTWTG